MRVSLSYTALILSSLEKSSSGSTPCEYIFIAIVIISTLPVRSPLPNNVPSILSAPAKSPSSAIATPVPLSLCG